MNICISIVTVSLAKAVLYSGMASSVALTALASANALIARSSREGKARA